MSRVFVVGSGALGSATGQDLRLAGHQVTFVDSRLARVEELTAQGLDAGVVLDLTGEPESFIFLCLPTPHDGSSYDLRALEDGAAQVGRALADTEAQPVPTRPIVVVRSTVPPGTTQELVGKVIEQVSGRCEGVDFGLAANPDFGRVPCSAGADDPGRPRLTVIGARSQRVAHRLGDLLGPLGAQVRIFEDPATAELIKCTSSLFNATKISFWNEIWEVCGRLGLDPDQVADTVADSAQGSVEPGFGIRGGAPYGGDQLPGDTSGFLCFAAELGIPMPLLSAVVEVNSRFERRLATELDGIGVLAAIPRSRGRSRIEDYRPAELISSPAVARIPRQLGR